MMDMVLEGKTKQETSEGAKRRKRNLPNQLDMKHPRKKNVKTLCFITISMCLYSMSFVKL